MSQPLHHRATEVYGKVTDDNRKNTVLSLCLSLYDGSLITSKGNNNNCYCLISVVQWILVFSSFINRATYCQPFIASLISANDGNYFGQPEFFLSCNRLDCSTHACTHSEVYLHDDGNQYEAHWLQQLTVWWSLPLPSLFTAINQSQSLTNTHKTVNMDTQMNSLCLTLSLSLSLEL